MPRAFDNTASLTPLLQEILIIAPVGWFSSIHAADTLSPPLRLAQMKANESRNFRLRSCAL